MNEWIREDQPNIIAVLFAVGIQIYKMRWQH